MGNIGRAIDIVRQVDNIDAFLRSLLALKTKLDKGNTISIGDHYIHAGNYLYTEISNAIIDIVDQKQKELEIKRNELDTALLWEEH